MRRIGVATLFILLVLVPMEVLIAIVTIAPLHHVALRKKFPGSSGLLGACFRCGLLSGHRSSHVATEPAHPFGREFFGLLLGVLNVIASVAALLLSAGEPARGRLAPPL